MAPIDDLLVRMDALLQPMRATGDERQHFLATYMRTTLAVKDELERGGFVNEARWTTGTPNDQCRGRGVWRSRRRTPRRACLRSGTCCWA